MIELFKITRASMKFDRMIPSGSSWLMGIRVQRVFDQAHTAMEPGKTIFISKSHQITGHTGEHLLKPTANYMKLRLIGILPPCEVCAKAKIRQRNIPKKKNEEATNQTWIQGIHGHLFVQASQQRRKQTLADCG